MDAPSCQGCRQRDVWVAKLEARLAELEAKVEDQAKLILGLARKLQDKDLPKGAAPASEQQPKSAKPPAKQPSKRKPGGQPGHPPHLKQLLPPEPRSASIASNRCLPSRDLTTLRLHVSRYPNCPN